MATRKNNCLLTSRFYIAHYGTKRVRCENVQECIMRCRLIRLPNDETGAKATWWSQCKERFHAVFPSWWIKIARFGKIREMYQDQDWRRSLRSKKKIISWVFYIDRSWVMTGDQYTYVKKHFKWCRLKKSKHRLGIIDHDEDDIKYIPTFLLNFTKSKLLKNFLNELWN